MLGTKRTILIAIGLCLLIFFQNCDRVSKPLLFSSAADGKSESQTSDSGVPYEGKIFVLGGQCVDGTKIQARLILKNSFDAALVRKDCVDIVPLALDTNDFKIDSTDPTKIIYQSQVFNAWVAQNVGAGYGTLPKLNNPVDPTLYGAVGDGVTDNTAAFTAALKVGDLLIPKGNYIVNGTVKVPAGRNVQCVSTSDVKIINQSQATVVNQTFQFGTVGGSLSNCSLSGANDFNPNGSATFAYATQFNYLVGIVDYQAAVSQVLVINNVFENCHGSACVVLYGGAGNGNSNNTVIYNTFRNCGDRGVHINGGISALISYNHLTDCGLNVQNSNTTFINQNNRLEGNYLTVVHGNGDMVRAGSSATWHLYLTGGYSQETDYTTNVVRYNTVAGNGLRGSIGILKSAPMPAKYENNSCINGCIEY